jgi:hypothetical protein
MPRVKSNLFIRRKNSQNARSWRDKQEDDKNFNGLEAQLYVEKNI